MAKMRWESCRPKTGDKKPIVPPKESFGYLWINGCKCRPHRFMTSGATASWARLE